ncbi:hypothetical protein C8Q78DRAFT_389638 [Trametes maxima]|nr:hypothetical protein C8Q78DRAFT_389638 [Trametes maxima]
MHYPTAGIKGLIKQAFPLLINLRSLEFDSSYECDIYKLLVSMPFRLRTFSAAGWGYPIAFKDVLASQPTIESLTLSFDITDALPLPDCIVLASSGSKQEYTAAPGLDRAELLPRMRKLIVDADRFPVAHINAPFAITHLYLDRANRNDLAHALHLFGSTLVALDLPRRHEAQPPESRFTTLWPTNMLSGARLPRLRYFKVFDAYPQVNDTIDPTFEPPDLDPALTGTLRAGCPELRTLVWAVEPEDMDQLTTRLDDSPTDMLVMRYTQMLFKALPRLARFANYDMTDPSETPEGLPYGHIFVKNGEGKVEEPAQKSVIDADKWLSEELAADASAETASST